MNNNDIKKRFCDLLFYGEPLNEKQVKEFSNILETMNERNIHVPYEMISKKVFYCEENDLSRLISSAKESLDLVRNRNTDNLIYSTIRHLELSKIQNEFIVKKTSKAEKELEKIKKNSKKISKIKDSIYTDLITVLGVFTAISFAAFGGITSISGMFSGLNDKTPHIGFLLVCSGISFLLIYGVAVTLFVGINKLIKADNIYTFSKWFTILAIFIPIIFIGMGIFLICTQ